MIKRIFISFIFLLLISQPVSAEPGFFSGFKSAFDTIKFLFSPEEPEDDIKQLDQDLNELRASLYLYQLEEFEQLLQQHKKITEKIFNGIQGINNKDLKQELKEIIKIKKQILQYDSKVKDLHVDLEIDIISNLKTNKNKINQLLAQLEKDADDLTIEIKDKEGKTITKIRASYEKNPEYIENIIKNLENDYGLNLWKQEELNRSLQRISKLAKHQSSLLNDRSIKDIENLSNFEEFDKVYELSEAMRKQLLNLTPKYDLQRKVRQIIQDTEEDSSLMILENFDN